MKRVVVILLTLALAVQGGKDTIRNRIKNVVVIMFENRSFDHFLGFLNRLNLLGLPSLLIF